MLLRFRFSNFRSFRDENELSLIAGTGGDEGRAVFAIPGARESVLPACALYGANASGKSNVLKALSFFVHAVLDSHRRWEPDGPLPLPAFCGDSASRDSEFEMDFVVEETRYRFGFKANVNELIEEWLWSYPNGRRQRWYARSSPADIAFGRTLTGDNKTIASFMRRNSLFLSAAAQNNHEALLPIYSWFRKSIHLVLCNTRVAAITSDMCLDREYRARIAGLMTHADLGISDIFVARHTLDNALTRETVMLEHRFGETVQAFEAKDESEGTLAYFSLLGPILRALENGSVLVIDEIDSSLHPSLLAFLVRLFCNKSSNPKGAQLIFNTHDTNLLAGGVLQRDQIWFTEKDREGVSHLYPLSDFKPRPDENFQKRYLQGRFGAIPFIDSERILEGPNVEAQPR